MGIRSTHWGRAWLLALNMTLAAGWVTACDSLGGDDDTTEEDDDDGGKKKKKKKKKRKKKKKKEEPEDDGPDPQPTAAPDPAPEPAPTGEAPEDHLKIREEKASAMPGAKPGSKLDYRTVPTTNVQIPMAPGWKGDRRGLYQVAYSPGRDAVLAFTTIGSRGELAGRLQNMRKTLKLNGYRPGKAKELKLGPDKLPAKYGNGPCKFGDTPGDMTWVLVNSGGRRLVLVGIAAEEAAPALTHKQAVAMVALMRKKR